MAGIPEYVECADRLDSFFGICSNMKLCVLQNTTHETFLRNRFPEDIVIASSAGRTYENFVDGVCNVLAKERNSLALSRLQEFGYEGEYVVGKNFFTKEPLAMVTREDDEQWSQIVDLVLDQLLAAERLGISKNNVELFNFTQPLLGDGIDLSTAVAAVGNFGELYDRHLEESFSRSRSNLLQMNCSLTDNGLFYTMPFGDTTASEQTLSSSSLLATIRKRGTLRCGVIGDRPGFANYDSVEQEWTGFEVDLCQAAAAGIILDRQRADDGVDDSFLFEIVPVSERRAISDLLDGTIDVALSMTAESLRDHALLVKSTMPYFYISADPTSKSYTMASLATEPELGDLLFWILTAMMHAEERSISSRTANQMLPPVSLLGADFTNMLRNAVAAVGNYGDLYPRHLEDLHPRSAKEASCNRLNELPRGPQQTSFWTTT